MTLKTLPQYHFDHAGRFLNRIDAWKHATECHQLSTTTQWYKDDHADCELYSEDLY